MSFGPKKRTSNMHEPHHPVFKPLPAHLLPTCTALLYSGLPASLSNLNLGSTSLPASSSLTTQPAVNCSPFISLMSARRSSIASGSVWRCTTSRDAQSVIGRGRAAARVARSAEEMLRGERS